MLNDSVIKVENVSKKFCKSLKRSIIYGVQDIARDMLGIGTNSEKLRMDEFWPLDNVSFKLKKGETLGIIGPNGAGKTTLLKLLNGIMMPDKGRIEVRGRVGALIEVGAGFHPMLTGRENIYVNGVILGMRKKEIDKNFDSIVDFADIGDFLDTPVKYYSSGMFVRLGFAVAVHCEPEILLVDEILSVGDTRFQRKSIRRMKEIITESNKSIVFVSHNMHAVRALCKYAIWLNNGKTCAEGPTKYVVSQYERFVDTLLRNESPQKLIALDPGYQSGVAKFTDIQLLNEKGERVEVVEFMDYLRIRAWYETEERINQPNFRFFIINSEENINVATPSSVYQGNTVDYIDSGTGYVDCVIERLPIMPGNYSVHVVLTSADFLVFHTRTPRNASLYVSHPSGKRKGVPDLLLNDCNVWIPCRIEHGR